MCVSAASVIATEARKPHLQGGPADGEEKLGDVVLVDVLGDTGKAKIGNLADKVASLDADEDVAGG